MFVLVLALLGTALPARADTANEPSSPFRVDPPPPRLPVPFVLPDLSHARFDLGTDWFLGRMAPANGSRPGAVAAIARVSAEANILVPRRVYVGAAYPFAAALPPDGGL